MKPILFGAVLGVLWLLVGVPLAPLAVVLPLLVQPVVLGFAAGVAARPLLPRMRGWAP